MDKPFNQLDEIATRLNNLRMSKQLDNVGWRWRVSAEGVEVNLDLIVHRVLEKVSVTIRPDEVDTLVDTVMDKVAEVIHKHNE